MASSAFALPGLMKSPATSGFLRAPLLNNSSPAPPSHTARAVEQVLHRGKGEEAGRAAGLVERAGGIAVGREDGKFAVGQQVVVVGKLDESAVLRRKAHQFQLKGGHEQRTGLARKPLDAALSEVPLGQPELLPGEFRPPKIEVNRQPLARLAHHRVAQAGPRGGVGAVGSAAGVEADVVVPGYGVEKTLVAQRLVPVAEKNGLRGAFLPLDRRAADGDGQAWEVGAEAGGPVLRPGDVVLRGGEVVTVDGEVGLVAQFETVKLGSDGAQPQDGVAVLLVAGVEDVEGENGAVARLPAGHLSIGRASVHAVGVLGLVGEDLGGDLEGCLLVAGAHLELVGPEAVALSIVVVKIGVAPAGETKRAAVERVEPVGSHVLRGPVERQTGVEEVEGGAGVEAEQPGLDWGGLQYGHGGRRVVLFA